MSRISYCRQIILEELQRYPGHPTAQEIYERVRQRLPRVSLATIYRNLEALVARGLVRKLESATDRRRFDGGLQDHYHLRCLACGRVEDAPLPLQEELNRLVGAQSNYLILGHNLEFYGLCPACRAKQAAPAPEKGEHGHFCSGTV